MSRAVLILSGGQSSRMGQDKATLYFHGKTLINYQQQRFEAAGWPVVAKLRDHRAGFMGPLAGIEAALLQYPDILEWVVVPVDMPTFSEAMCEQLFFEGCTRECPLAFEHNPLPIYLPASKQAIVLLDQWLSAPDQPRSVHAFHQALSGQWLASTSQRPELSNYNTPEQWQALLSQTATTNQQRNSL